MVVNHRNVEIARHKMKDVACYSCAPYHKHPVVAHYEYSPFGETIAQSGDLADTFKLRFSTKYWDEETRSYYYGHRHYVPKLGCWLSRDPIEEQIVQRLYLFLDNDAVNFYEYLGLNKVENPEDEEHWFQKALTYGESHRYGCEEWRNYSGKADRSSYYEHFKDVTLQAHSSVYPAISYINRSLISNELLDLIGISSGYIWQLDLGKTSLFYTKKTEKNDSECPSERRYYIRIKVQTNVQYLEKKDGKTCCVLKTFDPQKPTVLEISTREQAGDCVK
jgi:RHS repeat-associated protein